MSWRRSLLVAAVALATACSSTPEVAPSPTADERVAAVRALREAVADPAVELRSAVQQVVAVIESLRADPPADPDARLELLSGSPQEALAGLEAATEAARDIPFDASTPDAEAAEAAFTGVIERSEKVAAAARADVAAQVALAQADVDLAALTARWDERGSRNEQLQRLEVLAADAQALAEEVAALEEVASCLEGPDRRAAAARSVAEATLELRGYVAAHRGNDFDARREELAQDPYGLGATSSELDAAELPCWQEEAPVVAAAAQVDLALEALEQALNPPDLQG